MAGLLPANHVLTLCRAAKTFMPGTKAGHEKEGFGRYSGPCKDRLLSAALRGLRLLAALSALLAFDVLAGRLVDRLHGQTDLAALVDAEELYLHLVAFPDDVGDFVHPAWRELADVHQPVLGAEEIHEGAEVHDFHHGALVNVAHFRIRRDRLDPVDRRLDRFAARRGNLDRAVVLDVDLGAGLFDDLADHLAAGTDHLTDLAYVNLEPLNARSMLAELGASRGESLAHLTQNMHAAVLRLRKRDLHDLFGDPGNLDVHLQGRDALLSAGDLEVHVAKVILIAKDVGKHRVALVFEDEAHGDAGRRPLQRDASIHQRQRGAADRGHRRRTVGFGDLGNDTDRVRKLGRCRQHRVDRSPGKFAVTDLAAAGRADAAGFADRERREIIVQQERLLVRALQGIDELLVFGSAERRHHERLGLAAREHRRTVRPRQNADLRHDRANGLVVTAIDAPAGIKNVPAHDLGFELLEYGRHVQLVVFGVVCAAWEEVLEHFFFRGVHRLVTILLRGDRIGRAEILFDQAEDFLLELGVVGERQLAGFLGRLFRELDDGFDDRLEMPVAEHHRAQHVVLGQLFGFRFHHQHRIVGAGDDQIELALDHFVKLRVKNVVTVDDAGTCGADGAHERNAGQGERGGGRDHGNDIGIILKIVRQRGDNHLRVATPAVGEQRTHWPVNEARGQRLFLRRAAFSLEVAAGNPAGSEELFLIVDGQRQEVDSFLRRLAGNDGGIRGGLAIGGEHGPIGLPRDPAGFQG